MKRRPPPDSDKKPRRGADEDSRLWQHVTDSVKPLRPRRPRAAAAAEKAKTGKPAKPPAPAKTALIKTPADTPRARTAAATPRATPSPSLQMDRATETRLRRGEMEIDARIDLHDMTQDAAYAALNRFIARAVAADYRTLLVITGKGRLSEGGGVLRRLLPSWLQAGPHAGRILACLSAHQRHGGTGAYYVRLRRQRGRD
jgi:DNA-nicking Smr family endonuclease